VSGGDEALYAVVGEAEQQADRWRHEYVRHQHGKIGEAFAGSLPDGHGIRRGGSFETNREEDYLAIGILARDGDRVHGRVGDAYVAASALTRKRSLVDPERAACRHRTRVSRRAWRDGDGPIDDFQRGHADRTAGSVDEFQLRREKLIDAVAHQRVGLPPQISIRTQGRVTVAAISATRLRATLGSRYSSMNFMAWGASTGMLAGLWGSPAVRVHRRHQPDQNCVVRATPEPGLHLPALLRDVGGRGNSRCVHLALTDGQPLQHVVAIPPPT